MQLNKALIIVRFGLATVFLANSLTAFFDSGEFSKLLQQSFIYNLIPFSMTTFIMVIGTNDLILSLLIFLSRKWDKIIFSWATIWILGVMITLGKPLSILGETGFLAMALALLISSF